MLGFSMARKTHLPETTKNTGPLAPKARCGRNLNTVNLAPFGTAPSCKTCQKRP